MNTDQLLEKTLFLSRVPCFEDLELETLFPLAEKLVRKELNAEEVLFQPGETPFSLFFVVSGTVRMEFPEKETIAIFSEGDFFGDLELFSHLQRQTYAICEDYTVLYALPSGILFAALQESPKLTFKMLERYASLLLRRR
jgi:CRP-like cAMP-binding protein